MVTAHRRSLPSHSSLLSALADFVFSLLFEPTPYIAKSYELVRRKNFTDRQLIFEPQSREIGLCSLHLFQTSLKLFFFEGVAIDGHIESAVCVVHSALGLHHRGPARLIHSADLLNLFGRKTEFRQQIRPSIPMVIPRAVSRWRPVLGTDGTRGCCNCDQDN